YPDGKLLRLINEEKVEGYENGTTKRVFYKWHLNFDCDYKREIDKGGKENDTPINFFKVTIYDLDLYTSGLLNEQEFITYLYFIRSYNSGNEIWHSINKLSEKLNIKDTRITEKIVERLLVTRVKDQFCREDEDFPLVHVDRPNNYKRKIRERQQPSSFYKPVYNIKTCERLSDPNQSQDNQADEDVNEESDKYETWGFNPNDIPIGDTSYQEDDLSLLDDLD
ncbi:hypothetical protein, partial [Cytobacillus firmus]